MNINFKRPPAVCPRQTSRHVQYLEQNELFHPSDDDHSLRELTSEKERFLLIKSSVKGTLLYASVVKQRNDWYFLTNLFF